jgi:hypothetical protein
MNQKLKNFLFFAIATLSLMVVDKLCSYPKNWVWKILPNTILRLDKDIVLGLLITFSASIIAWFLGVIFSYILGIITSATLLGQTSGFRLKKWGVVVNKIYDGIYVVPFVLVTSLTYASAMTLYTNYSIPRFIVLLTLLFTAGAALGGYQVYKGIYEAVSKAKKETCYLVESLYLLPQKKNSLRYIEHPLRKVHLYRDCEIIAFSQRIENSLYLSVVAVMIIEAILPFFYEFIFAQHGGTKPWLGGIGKQIIDAQNTYQIERIAGCIWSVIFFSWILVFFVNQFMHKYWLKYYGDTK